MFRFLWLRTLLGRKTFLKHLDQIRHKGLLIVLLPVLVSSALSGLLWQLSLRADREHDSWNRRSRFLLDVTRLTLAQCVTGADLFKYWLGGSVVDLEAFAKEQKVTRTVVNRLRNSLNSHPEENQVPGGIELAENVLDRMNELADAKPRLENVSAFGQLKRDAGKVLLRLNEVKETMRLWLQREQKFLLALSQWTWWINLSGIIANISLTLLLLAYVKREFIDRIDILTTNVNRVERGESADAIVSGSDEIAELDRAFRAMNAELAARHEKERIIFDSSPDVIMIVGRDMVLDRVNLKAEQLWNTTALAGRDIGDLFDSTNRMFLESSLLSSQQSQRAASLETLIQISGRQDVVYLWTCFWWAPQAVWYCVGADITEMRDLERQRRELRSLLATDLDTPLISISETLQKLLAGSFGSLATPVSQRIVRIGKMLDRLRDLVEQLLAVDALQSDWSNCTRSTQLIELVLSASVAEVVPLASQKHVSVVVDVQNLEWCVDGSQMIRVFVNLLANAIKFTDCGGTVQVKAREQDNHVLVEIIDSGRGISEEDAGKLFAPFSQLKKEDSGRGVGSGLGLTVCRQIVAEHGGEIGVCSRPDFCGSIFWLTIPRIESSATAPMDGIEPCVELAIAPSSVGASSKAGATHSRGRFWGFQSMILLMALPMSLGLVIAMQVNNFVQEEEKLFACQIRSNQVSGSAATVVLAMLGLSVSTIEPSLRIHNRQICWQWQDGLDKLSKQGTLEPLARTAYSCITSFVERNGLSLPAVKNVIEFGGEEDLALLGNRLFFASAIVSKDVLRLIDRIEKRDIESFAARKRLYSSESHYLAFGLLLNLALGVTASLFLTRNISRKFSLLSSNCKRFASGNELLPELKGSDEISQLDAKFRSMYVRVAREKLREQTFFLHSPNLLCVLDSSGVVTRINPAACSQFAVTESQVLHHRFEDLVGKQTGILLGAELSHATQNRTVNFVTSTLRSDDSVVEVAWSASWCSQEARYICLGSDISRKVSVECFKQRSMALLSHDLRTPLSTISVLNSMVLSRTLGEIPAPAEAPLREIDRQLTVLLEIVNDILDLERLQSGKLLWTEDASPLLQVFQLVSQKLSTKLNTFSEDSDVEFLIDESHVICGPEDRLADVFAALICECLYTEPALVQVLSRATTEGLEIVLRSVSPQVAPDMLISKINDPSLALHAASRGSRLQLKLAIVLVEALAGEVSARGITNGFEVAINFCSRRPPNA